MHILLTGGGSGGHVFPLIAVARQLKKLGQDEGATVRLHYMGPTDFGRDLLALENIAVHSVSAAKWRRYASVENITDLFKIPLGLLQAAWKLFWIMPDVIFSKGGYGSLPALWLGRFYRIPVMIHESDTIPGLANTYSAKFAKRIFTSFDKTNEFFPKEKVVQVGNPVRCELSQCRREAGKEALHIQFKKPVIFITGGSQGAQKINDVVVNTLPHLLERYEIIHQCGTAHVDEIRELTQKEYKAELLQSYHLYGLLTEEELCAAYGVCDVVVARAGAGNIFEIAQAGKPSVIIPLAASAGNHQFENANAYARHGACTVLDEQNLTQNLFLEAIAGIVDNAERRLTMIEGAKKFSRPDAAEKIAREIFDYVLHRNT